MVTDVRIPTKKKELPPIVKRPDRPENLHLSKADFVKWNNADKAARKKAKEAYNKTMAETTGVDTEGAAELKQADDEVRKRKQLVVTLTKNLKELEEELKDAAPGEIRGFKMNITKTKGKIEVATERLKEAEEEYVEVKKSQG